MGIRIKIIALKTIIPRKNNDFRLARLAAAWLEPDQSVIGAQPQIPGSVFEDAIDLIVCKPILLAVALEQWTVP